MDPIAAPTWTFATLATLSAGVGAILFLWVLVGRPVEVGPVKLPQILSLPTRLIIGAIGLLAFFLGARGIYQHLDHIPVVTIATNMAEEEVRVFDEDVQRFEQEGHIKVDNINKSADPVLELVKQDQVDILTFDINERDKIYEAYGLLWDFNNEPEHRLKVVQPSSVNPVLLDHLELGGRRLFLPFRPNVEVLLVNKEAYKRFEDSDVYKHHHPTRSQSRSVLDKASATGNPGCPRTCQDLALAAKWFKKEEGQERVVVQAQQTVAPLTMLQIVRAAGGVETDLTDHRTIVAFDYFFNNLWPYISDKSAKVDWNTAAGFLLSESVYIERNWAFTLGILKEAKMLDEFEVCPGLGWDDGTGQRPPANLLGGDVLVLLASKRDNPDVIRVARYLISRDLQAHMVKNLFWPAMRLDALGEICDEH